MEGRTEERGKGRRGGRKEEEGGRKRREEGRGGREGAQWLSWEPAVGSQKAPNYPPIPLFNFPNMQKHSHCFIRQNHVFRIHILSISHGVHIN